MTNLKRIALFLCLVLAVFAQGNLPVVEVHIAPGVGAVLDESDLGNGWYGEPKVPFGVEYADVLAWLQENGVPERFGWHTAFTTDPGRPAPTSIIFEGEAVGVDNKRFWLRAAFDAVQVFRSPGTALADIRAAFGAPLSRRIEYPGFGPRNDVDPVGKRIAFRLYDVSDKFDQGKWPLGSVYVRVVKINDVEDQEHYERTNRFEPGGFFQPAKVAPAWLRLR